MKAKAAAIGLTIALLTIGCGAQARSPEPVPVDRVECARCRMLVSSDSGGGQIVSASDDTRFYDDIACLAADWALRSRSGQPRDQAFVRLANGKWSDARDASYAQPAGVRTAMGSGFVAFASIADAQAADREGRALTFDDVVGRAGGSR